MLHLLTVHLSVTGRFWISISSQHAIVFFCCCCFLKKEHDITFRFELKNQLVCFEYKIQEKLQKQWRISDENLQALSFMSLHRLCRLQTALHLIWVNFSTLIQLVLRHYLINQSQLMKIMTWLVTRNVCYLFLYIFTWTSL